MSIIHPSSPFGQLGLLNILSNSLDYEMRLIDVTKAEQKEPWYLEINPNGRVPAVTDVLPDGKEVKLFESGSIMQYLVDRYDKDHKLVPAPALRFKL